MTFARSERMRQIRLTGREQSTMKALGFSDAVPGSELQQYTQMQPDDLVDTLNGLLAAGYVESHPYREEITVAEMMDMTFEVNPGYAHELRAALLRPWT